MEPAQALWALFYVWLLVAVGVWVWRAYRRFVHHETRQDREARRAAGPSAAPAAREVVRPASAEPGEELAEGSLVRDAIRAELAERRQREAAEGAAADAAGAPDGDDSGDGGADQRRGVFARREPERRPVADVVQGIAMPCDLVPLVVDAEIDPHRVVFATTGHGPEEVGAAVADELERLGFAVRTVGDTEAVATRAGDELHVVVHPDAARAEAGGVRQFPTAPAASVVVELRT